jgi:hypothetical protein
MNRSSDAPGGTMVWRATWAKLILGALAACLLLAGFGPAAPSASASPTAMVDLGSASTYAALSGASVANADSAPGDPHTTLRGDLGVKANAPPTGFPPGTYTGTLNVGNAAAAQAHADLVTAYNEVAGRTGGTALAPGAVDLIGMTIGPGLYTIGGAASNTGTVTLDGGGNPNAVFVFQINGALSFAAASHVVLTNGAQASRVFWQVNGAGDVGAGGSFAGTLMALNAVGFGNGTIVNGRAFARTGALTLYNNQFYSAPPAVTIAGGTNAYTTDATPTISGTTDVEAPGVVTVTVNGQTLTATPADGAWSVTSAILVNGTYPVVASVRDAAGNTGSYTQQLTVDTVLPVVTLEGGASATTNDPTPTIVGTSDVAPGTSVHVDVDSQLRTATVQSDGSWSVVLLTLADGTYTVTASVSDPAGNLGTDSQELTVDTAAPAVSIAGGSNALTNDATPVISGTADVPPGTTVTVTLADETLSGVVQGDGTWSVSAAALSDGPHQVVMTVSDAAGNQSSFTQTLTVDTISPVVAITGGANATTNDVTPTITGTSDAAPGATVTVSIAGQTMTTLLQANGRWNATPDYVGNGTWTVVASVADPAGNLGSADQTLVIAPDAPPPTPIAVDDSAIVIEDSSANAIDVLANDTDAGSVQLTSDPANGTAAITGGGTGISYSPDAGYCNDPGGAPEDGFTYTLNGGSTATVSMTVTCVDDAAPIAPPSPAVPPAAAPAGPTGRRAVALKKCKKKKTAKARKMCKKRALKLPV